MRCAPRTLQFGVDMHSLPSSFTSFDPMPKNPMAQGLVKPGELTLRETQRAPVFRPPDVGTVAAVWTRGFSASAAVERCLELFGWSENARGLDCCGGSTK